MHTKTAIKIIIKFAKSQVTANIHLAVMWIRGPNIFSKLNREKEFPFKQIGF